MLKRTPFENLMNYSISIPPVDKYKDMYTTFTENLINSFKDNELWSGNDIIEAEKIKKLEEYRAELEGNIDRLKELDNASSESLDNALVFDTAVTAHLLN